MVPLHLLAFAALYMGLLHLLKTEVVRGHVDSARLFTREVVDGLHPVMELSEPQELNDGIEEFLRSHDLLHLRLHDTEGRSLSGEKNESRAVRSFLGSGETSAFHLDRVRDRWTLEGLVRIDATGQCADCHSLGEVVAVAGIGYDVTPYLVSSRVRVRRGLTVLMVIWLAAVGIVNVVAVRATRRTVKNLRDSVSGSPEIRGMKTGSGSVLMDGVSAELLGSLRQVLEEQQRRDREVASRLGHTDRLALVGQLAAGLAHEIKNPVAGLQGALELLIDETRDEEKRHLFEQMLAETGRVTDTVQQLLEFARPVRPKPLPTDIDSLCTDIVHLLAASLSRQNVVIDLEMQAQAPPMHCDPVQIRQVLVNLIRNAAEAMPDGGHVVVRARYSDDDDTVVIEVVDDGPGLSDELVDRVFEPFFSTKAHGTGLGLAVARTHVEQHGGRILVHSGGGQGTVFVVVLPALRVETGEGD